MAILNLGFGVFVDSERVSAPHGVTSCGDVYAWAEFPSLERVRFGLRKTSGGPKGDEVDSVQVGSYGMEPLAPYWDPNDAINELEKSGGKSRWAFEEVPYVEVTSKADYDRALKAMGIKLRDGDWKKPGLYDFRDEPPSFSETLSDYEDSELERAADDAFEYMFQGDEWEQAYAKLCGRE